MNNKEYAGFWIRVGANLIDLIIFVVIYGVLSLLSMYLFSDLYLQNVNYQNSYSSFDFFELFFQYLLPFIVTIWFWIKFQATPGKMATQLRLVDEKTGLSISTGQAVGRYFATILSMVIFGLGYLWIVFDRRNQSWHDKLAGTVVIRNRHTERVIFNVSKDNDEEEEKS